MSDDTSLGATLDAVNEAMVAAAVKAGTMPPGVLDHLGHLKHDIYSLGCEYCVAKK